MTFTRTIEFDLYITSVTVIQINWLGINNNSVLCHTTTVLLVGVPHLDLVFHWFHSYLFGLNSWDSNHYLVLASATINCFISSMKLSSSQLNERSNASPISIPYDDIFNSINLQLLRIVIITWASPKIPLTSLTTLSVAALNLHRNFPHLGPLQTFP